MVSQAHSAICSCSTTSSVKMCYCSIFMHHDIWQETYCPVTSFPCIHKSTALVHGIDEQVTWSTAQNFMQSLPWRGMCSFCSWVIVWNCRVGLQPFSIMGWEIHSLFCWGKVNKMLASSAIPSTCRETTMERLTTCLFSAVSMKDAGSNLVAVPTLLSW